MQITYYGDSEGEPWGLFTEGHVDLIQFAAEAEEWCAVHGHDLTDFGRYAQPAHLYMVEEKSPARAAKIEAGKPDDFDEEIDDEYPWHWCEAGTPGAVAVTAYRA